MATQLRVRREWLPAATLLGVIGCAWLFGFAGLGSRDARTANAGIAVKEAAAAGVAEPAIDALPTRGTTLSGMELPEQVEARHVLVQFDGAWKKESQEPLSREAAQKLATEALAALRRGAAFDSVLERYGNNSSVRAEQGKFPTLTRKQTMTAIANAVFPLKVGEYSEVTESVFGFHVFQRTQ